VAEGEARAITTVYQAIHAGDPSPDLLAIKYLETLGRIANGQATKIYLPADFASGLGSLATVAELFAGSGTDEEGRETRASQARAALDRQVEETASRRIAPTAGRSSATTEAAIPAQAPVVAPAPLPQPPAAPPPPPPV
jgi:hypothetical protein